MTTLRAAVVAMFAIGFIRAPSAIRFLNPVVRAVFGAGVPAGPNVLLSVRGRSSGVERTFPVSLLEIDGRRYVQGAFGEVAWVRNLRAAGVAVLRRGRAAEPVRAVELDPETAGRIFHDALASYPRSRSLGRFLGPDIRPPVAVLRYFRIRIDTEPADYVAAVRRQPVFELVGVGERGPAKEEGDGEAGREHDQRDQGELQHSLEADLPECVRDEDDDRDLDDVHRVALLGQESPEPSAAVHESAEERDQARHMPTANAESLSAYAADCQWPLPMALSVASESSSENHWPLNASGNRITIASAAIARPATPILSGTVRNQSRR
jgi:deazaflavin-dependent oxidoreductase (nitroreductase family)